MHGNIANHVVLRHTCYFVPGRPVFPLLQSLDEVSELVIREAFFFFRYIVVQMRFIRHFNTQIASLIPLCVCKPGCCFRIYQHASWLMNLLGGRVRASLNSSLPAPVLGEADEAPRKALRCFSLIRRMALPQSY